MVQAAQALVRSSLTCSRGTPPRHWPQPPKHQCDRPHTEHPNFHWYAIQPLLIPHRVHHLGNGHRHSGTGVIAFHQHLSRTASHVSSTYTTWALAAATQVQVRKHLTDATRHARLFTGSGTPCFQQAHHLGTGRSHPGTGVSAHVPRLPIITISKNTNNKPHIGEPRPACSGYSLEPAIRLLRRIAIHNKLAFLTITHTPLCAHFLWPPHEAMPTLG